MRDTNQINHEIRCFREDIISTRKCIEKHKSRMSKESLASYENDIVELEEKIRLLNEEIKEYYETTTIQLKAKAYDEIMRLTGTDDARLELTDKGAESLRGLLDELRSAILIKL